MFSRARLPNLAESLVFVEAVLHFPLVCIRVRCQVQNTVVLLGLRRNQSQLPLLLLQHSNVHLPGANVHDLEHHLASARWSTDCQNSAVTLVGCVATARVGVPGGPSLLSAMWVSTWGACFLGTAVGAERAGMRSFGPDWELATHCGVFPSFAPFAVCSRFRGTGSRSDLLRCTGRPGSQRNPAPGREVVDNRRHECGARGRVWAKASRMGFP